MSILSSGTPKPTDPRSLFLALLHDALVTIRNDTQGHTPPARLERAHHLADWTHNWPNWLRDAQSDDDFRVMWGHSTDFCHPVVREWAGTMVAHYGVTARELGLHPEL